MMREVEVDWASFVRGAVEEKVREEKRKNAMKLMDESRRKFSGEGRLQTNNCGC